MASDWHQHWQGIQLSYQMVRTSAARETADSEPDSPHLGSKHLTSFRGPKLHEYMEMIMAGIGSAQNLEAAIARAGDPVKLLRASETVPFLFPGVPPEYTNWGDEQWAWRHGVALLELSYHMTDLYIKGPDAVKLLAHVCVNNFEKFPPKRAKQIVACAPDGNLICDGIVFHLEQDHFRVVGSPIISDWVQFNAETGDYNVELHRDETVAFRPGDPEIYIFQIQGPHALELMRDVIDGSLPEIGFFHIGDVKIAGRNVRALRHGMAGEPGFELFGPWSEQEPVREAIIKAGERYGMKKVGSLAYPMTAVESSWLALPIPAVYTDPALKHFREWLPSDSMGVQGSLGGSFYSPDISDYYVDLYSIGYAGLADFEHDFIGRDSLRDRSKFPTRKKVALEWNNDDVGKAIHDSLFRPEHAAKRFHLPLTAYSTFPYDEILRDGGHAGTSHFAAYTTNAGTILSTALIDAELSEPGTEVTVLWGETNPMRTSIEKHEVREIRATVAAAPYFEKRIAKD